MKTSSEIKMIVPLNCAAATLGLIEEHLGVFILD